jgi:putative peptide zinc metalloprotease protein
MLIAGMGIMTELFIASLALFIWLLVEPGAVRTLAYSIMLISGVSTLLFNGNPLLRFDGYFVLADALEIPNLSSRSQTYLGYLVERYVFRIEGLKSPAMSHDERFWLVAYGVASFVFRYVVMLGIILYIGDKFFVFGLLLATWAVLAHVLLPLGRRINYLLASPRLKSRRNRALGISLCSVLALAILLFAVPAPLATKTEGVVWTPDEAEVRAAADAFVKTLVARPNMPVAAGDVLLVTEDPELAANVAILDADLREATVRYHTLRAGDEFEAGNVLEEMKSIEASLARARERLAGLTIVSPSDGIFLLDRPQDIEGRYLLQGDLVGFVADLSRATVRVAVLQEDIGLIRSRTRHVALRFADDPRTDVAASIRRVVPAASDRLPSAVLGASGGGRIPINAADASGTQTIESVFHIELDAERPVTQIGGRTFVRFSHGYEPVGLQWYRRVRQLFLRRFDV